MLEARERADLIVKEAEKRAEELEAELLSPLEERETRLEKTEDRLRKREEFLDDRERSLSEEGERVRSRENEAANLKKEAEHVLKERRAELSRISGLSEEEARARLIKEVEDASEEAVLTRLQKLEAHGKERLEEKARTLLTTVIHRLGNAVNAEVTTLAVPLPSEELKGKVIGKEGRNIKALSVLLVLM